MRVVYVVRNHPLPSRSGGSMRIAAIVQGLEKLGHEVSYFDVGELLDGTKQATHRDSRAVRRSGVWANETLADEAGPWVKDPLGQPSDADWLPHVHQGLAGLLSTVDPEVVILDTPLTKAAIPTIRNFPARIVLDSHNVDGLLSHDLLHLRNDLAGEDPTYRLIARRAGAIERHTADRVDAVWACSPADRDAYLDLTGTPTFIVPNAVIVTEPAVVRRDVHQLLFTGSLGYLPNRDAVRWLLEMASLAHDIEPRTSLVVAGSSPPPSLINAARTTSWLSVTGSRDSFADLFAASGMAVIPLRAGGGTRLKALEAFAAGLPVVSTSKGVEGLDVRDGEHFLLAETTAQFVEAMESLWSNPGLYAAVATAAFDLVQRSYSLDALSRAIDTALAHLDGSRRN